MVLWIAFLSSVALLFYLWTIKYKGSGNDSQYESIFSVLNKWFRKDETKTGIIEIGTFLLSLAILGFGLGLGIQCANQPSTPKQQSVVTIPTLQESTKE